MSVKKQIPSFSTLSSIYEEVTESFLDETDVDSSVYHNMLDFALMDSRTVRVINDSNKKNFVFELFQFCNLRKINKDSIPKRRCQFY